LDTDGDGLNISGGSTYGHRIHTNNTEKLELGVNNSTKLVIDSSGRVGIGTSSPSTPIHVSTNTDGTSDLLTLHADADGTNNGIASIKFTGNTGNHAAFIKGGHTTNGDSILTFHTDAHDSGINPEERMRIDSSGRVGIGDTSPDGALVVKGTASVPHTVFKVNSQSESTKFSVQTVQDSDIRIGTQSNHPLALYTNQLERMRILSSGNVAIGSTTASSPLHVFGIDTTIGLHTYPQLTLQTASTDGAADKGSGIMFLNHDGGSGKFGGNIRVLNENSTSGNHASFMAFSTRPTGGSVSERMRIDSSGNMALGTTSPNSQSGYTSLTLNNATNGSIFDLRQNDTALTGGRLVGTANQFGLESRSQSSSSQISFYVKNVYTGRWTVNGLCFGNDTAAANALDDYEEGTFTPTINGSLSGGIRQGFYVKVGQLVMVTMMIKWTANSGAGGGVGIGGFPFASTNTGSTYHRAGASWGFTQGLDNQGNKQLTFNINANVTAGGIHVINDNASAGAIGAQDCSSSGEIQLTVNYRST
jgi:hypothetical protein